LNNTFSSNNTNNLRPTNLVISNTHCLSIVGGGLGDLLGLEHDILDGDLSAGVAGKLDPRSVGLQDTGSDEEVVGVAGGGNPSLALISADLQALSTASGVLDSRGEPVLGGTTVHVDVQRSLDGALDELPLDAVNTAGGEAVGEFRPSSRGHVEVVLVAAGLVGDLFERISRCCLFGRICNNLPSQ
jgi:hypothetical protein